MAARILVCVALPHPIAAEGMIIAALLRQRGPWPWLLDFGAGQWPSAEYYMGLAEPGVARAEAGRGRRKGGWSSVPSMKHMLMTMEIRSHRLLSYGGGRVSALASATPETWCRLLEHPGGLCGEGPVNPAD